MSTQLEVTATTIFLNKCRTHIPFILCNYAVTASFHIFFCVALLHLLYARFELTFGMFQLFFSSDRTINMTYNFANFTLIHYLRLIQFCIGMIYSCYLFFFLSGHLIQYRKEIEYILTKMELKLTTPKTAAYAQLCLFKFD